MYYCIIQFNCLIIDFLNSRLFQIIISTGVSFVPILLMLYGASSTAASFSTGFLIKSFSVINLIYFSLLIEVSLFSTLTLWWTPAPGDPVWYFSAYSAGFGLCIGLGRSLLSQVYSQLYQGGSSAAGMALLGSGEAVSSCILFGLGDVTPPVVKIVLTLCCGVFGSVLCHAAWSMKDGEKRFYRRRSSL